MISLEQVKLLESKVTRMIEYVGKVTDENTKLKEKLDSYEKRTGELEVLFQRFKDDQSRIEDGVLSALDLLNQFEDAVGGKLSGINKSSSESKPSGTKKPAQAQAPQPQTFMEDAGMDIDLSEEALEEEALEEEPLTLLEDDDFEDKDEGPALSGAELDIF